MSRKSSCKDNTLGMSRKSKLPKQKTKRLVSIQRKIWRFRYKVKILPVHSFKYLLCKLEDKTHTFFVTTNVFPILTLMSQDSSFSIVTMLQTEEPRNQSLSPGRGKRFSLLHITQTSSGAHQASYTMGPGCCFPGDK
jgi:hypothetical protein